MITLRNASPAEVERAYDYTLQMADEIENHHWGKMSHEDWVYLRTQIENLKRLGEYLYRIHHAEQTNGNKSQDN